MLKGMMKSGAWISIDFEATGDIPGLPVEDYVYSPDTELKATRTGSAVWRCCDPEKH